MGEADFREDSGMISCSFSVALSGDSVKKRLDVGIFFSRLSQQCTEDVTELELGPREWYVRQERLG